MKVELAREQIPVGCSRIPRAHGWWQITPGRYVHRPRSGWSYSDGRVSFVWWCGPYARVRSTTRSWDHEPTQEEHDGMGVCGSCTGRAEAWLEERKALVFEPRNDFGLGKRVWCPADRWGVPWLPDPENDRLGICLLCGYHDRIIGRGSVWTPSVGLKIHRLADGPRLPPFGLCPYHGWRNLRLGRPDRDWYSEPTHVVCRDHGCTWSTPLHSSTIHHPIAARK